MILIADSGSTKTDWNVVIDGKSVQRVFTKGINPFFQTEKEVSGEIETTLLPFLQEKQFDSIYFYGAGCVFDKVKTVETALRHHLHAENVEVGSDMLAAARALCAQERGIACILGTGSNSCYYDGKAIADNVSPLGFILGDEGSGATLGKLLVGDLLKNRSAIELKEKFLEKYELTVAEIIHRVYREPFPNRFLAGFTPFVLENIQCHNIQELVKNSFKSFLQRNVMQYRHYEILPIHFTGSVAFYFKKTLRETMEELKLQVGKIAQSPMEGLIEYHSEKRKK